MSSSTTIVKEMPLSAKEKKEFNDNFVKAFKKQSGVKKQTTLPTASVMHNEWAIKSGWSMADAMTWRCLCEKVKFAQDDAEASALFAVVNDTIEIAAHCQTHPVGLIHFARTSLGVKNWDMDAIEFVKDNLLMDPTDPDNEATLHLDQPEDQDDIEDDRHQDDFHEPAGKRKRMEASQPWQADDAI